MIVQLFFMLQKLLPNYISTLKKVVGYASANTKDFTRQINEMFSAQQVDNVKSKRKKLKVGENRHAELDKLIQRLYEDNVAGKLNDKRYGVLSNRYEQEQAELEQTIATNSIPQAKI